MSRLWTVLVAAAGLMTHYFYGFVLAAFFLWLMLYPGRFSRGWGVGLGGAVVLVVAPWYIKLPVIFSTWRLTGNWLLIPSGNRTIASLQLPWSLVSFSGVLRAYNAWDFVVLGVLTLVVIVVVLKNGWRIFSPESHLLILWLSAACLGPVAFDLILNSFVTLEPRYALTGMPAALLLIAFALGKLPAGWRHACILVIIVSWLPHLRYVMTTPWRYWEPFKQVADVLDHQAHSSHLLIVHSTPTGIICVARYVNATATMYSWVGQLGQRRVPEDIRALAEKYDRIVLVKVHTVGEPAPEETWLRKHAATVEALKIVTADVLIFDTRNSRISPQQ